MCVRLFCSLALNRHPNNSFVGENNDHSDSDLVPTIRPVSLASKFDCFSDSD